MIYKPKYFNDHGQEVPYETKGSMYYIAAFNDNGDYVGNRKDGRFFEKRGIKPELRTSTSQCCSIGFCEAENKWYGWSHRAIYGFGIGSTVKLGDCAFNPSNKDEFLKSLEAWYELDITEGMYRNFKLTPLENGVKVQYDFDNNSYESIVPWPEKWGRGEWIAQTLEDAREMAEAFAEDVS
jgi:hypothetical protein